MLSANTLNNFQTKIEAVIASRGFGITAILGGGGFSITAFTDLIEGILAIVGVLVSIAASVAFMRYNNSNRKKIEAETQLIKAKIAELHAKIVNEEEDED